MAKTIQSIRGMRDIVPPEADRWRALENSLIQVLESYGYANLRTPILEPTDLFTHSLGETTDVVQKEMYTFDDRSGDSLSLRPEGTASAVRALIQNGLSQLLPLRLWYLGPMFRHERPQKGRYRQFHQLGAEVFGLSGPDIDAELILMTAAFWRALGLTDLRLEINSLGSPEARQAYRDLLVAYFKPHIHQLDEDSKVRLERNPLRILDSKNPAMSELIKSAPPLTEAWDEPSARHFDGVIEILTAAGIDYVINPQLVRGLDYYSHTVFEWKTDALGAQDTVCAGGRYDAMVEHFGGKSTPAIGFAAGVERLYALLEQTTQLDSKKVRVYVIIPEPNLSKVFPMIERVRNALPTHVITSHLGGGSMKSQFKKADRLGADFAVILGEDEITRNEYTVKALRSDAEQRRGPLDQVVKWLSA